MTSTNPKQVHTLSLLQIHPSACHELFTDTDADTGTDTGTDTVTDTDTDTGTDMDMDTLIAIYITLQTAAIHA